MDIVAEDLSVGYRGRAVAEHLSFTARAGQITALIGVNGAGKSTIIKTLLGQLSPLAGTYRFGERNGVRMRKEDRARKVSAVLTEQIHPAYMCVYDVVATGRYPYTGSSGRLQRADVEAVEEALELLSIAHLGAKNFMELSDGQKQMVLLARAVAQGTEVMLLDEPISHLDIRYQMELLSVLERLAKEQNKTIFLSLHEIRLASRMADMILAISRDHSYTYGEAKELMSERAMEELFGVDRGRLGGSMKEMKLL